MIKLEQVSKIYSSGTVALCDVSLHIKKGEFVSVIGPSGAGKTTLFALINGAQQSSGGRIYIDGRQFHDAKGRAKRETQKRIAMIYQDFCLVEQSSCLQNVLNAVLAKQSFVQAMFNHYTKAQKEEAMEALSRVGLAEKAWEQASHLSGGQKQRVAIARALMQRPTVLLADEPVASLDPVTGNQILELLTSIQEQQDLTIVMNSHNVRLSLNYTKRVIGLRDGKIALDEKADNLDERLLSKIYGQQWKEAVK